MGKISDLTFITIIDAQVVVQVDPGADDFTTAVAANSDPVSEILALFVGG